MTARTNRYEDDDASHLPPGMKRVGYDTDTERYTFREGDDLWLGEPGSFYGGQMKWAGKAPGATARRDSRVAQDAGPNIGTEHSQRSPARLSSRSRFQEHVRKAHSYSTTSVKHTADGDWGVPVISISATGAEPPDSAEDNGGLKRRASKIKNVAEMAVDAFGLNRRWTKKRPTTEAAQREKVFLSSERSQTPEGGRRGSEESNS